MNDNNKNSSFSTWKNPITLALNNLTRTFLSDLFSEFAQEVRTQCGQAGLRGGKELGWGSWLIRTFGEGPGEVGKGPARIQSKKFRFRDRTK